MGRRRIILIAIAVAIALAVVYLAATGHRRDAALLAYQQQLRAQGEKLTIAEIAPKVTAEQAAAARNLDHAMDGLSAGLRDYPAAMHYVAPSRVMISWKEEIAPGWESTNAWPAVTAGVLKNKEPLEGLCTALQSSNIQFDVNYSAGFLASLTHLAKLKKSAIWLTEAGLVALRENRPTNALMDLTASINLVRPLEHEPFEISQLVRIAIGQIALNATGEFLDYSNWQDAQLAGLQMQWDSKNLFDETPATLEMERAQIPVMYNLARSAYSNYYSLQGNFTPPTNFWGSIPTSYQDFSAFANEAGARVSYWNWRGHWSYAEELYKMRVLQAALDSARQTRKNDAFVVGLMHFDTNLAAIRNDFTNSIGHFTYDDSGVVQKVLLKIADIEVQRRILVTAIALKRFHLRNGKYPGNLDQLVPDFLQAVPIDFMDGKPLRYRPDGHGAFVLYSVGEDGKDDGGDPTPQENSASGKSWWKGKDAVWPLPGTPEQVKAYKDDVIAKQKAKGPGIRF